VELNLDLVFKRHFDDLRGSWQVRALIETQNKHVGVVLLSVLAHTYDDAMHVVMRVAFPGFTSIVPPFLCTAGKIAKTGAVVADVVQRNGTITKNTVLYKNSIKLRDDFRRLADKMRLNDDERLEMFSALKRWIVCDYRLDPTMDPQDPDAKRLVAH
jgi:hypothetical protein